MNDEKDIQIYDKIDLLCKKIENYTTKAISVKSEVKNTIYTDKLTKLINMINYAEKIQGYNPESQENLEKINETIVSEEIKEDNDDKYNPDSDDFCLKDKLQKNNGDVEALIKELKAEDKLGFRNAYIINEIRKYKKQENDENSLQNKRGFFSKIKNMVNKKSIKT